MSRTLLVTGGAGFIGANFVLDAIARGDRIVNLDALTYAGSRANLASVEKHARYTFVHGDIRDRALVDALLARHEPNAIVHFAAESHVDRSIDAPDVFVSTNVFGTLCLLNAVRAYTRSGKRVRFLHVSTDEIYGSLGPIGYFTEESRVDPSSPYSASKAASDHLVRAYHRTYGLDTVTTNCCNNYGPYQLPEKLVPLVILNALEAKPLPVYGDGMQRRDWIFVQDHCAGVALALEKGRSGETYALGARTEVANLDMVHLLCDLVEERRPAKKNAVLCRQGLGSYHDLVRHVSDRPGHDRRYAIDPRKSETELGFAPNTTLRDALGQTIDWYLSNLAWCQHIDEKRRAREPHEESSR
jgi:dTDP-glucose 4,6-dehydratase